MNDNVISFNDKRVKLATLSVSKKYHYPAEELSAYASALLSKKPVMTLRELEESVELYMIRKIYG